MKVGVIMGGTSSERDISLLTGQEMINHLDKNRYEVVPIELNTKRDLIDKSADIDVALLALHGKYGEDGTVQGTLESLGIPYTGCGACWRAVYAWIKTCPNSSCSMQVCLLESGYE